MSTATQPSNRQAQDTEVPSMQDRSADSVKGLTASDLRVRRIRLSHEQPGAAVDFLDMGDAARTALEGLGE